MMMRDLWGEAFPPQIQKKIKDEGWMKMEEKKIKDEGWMRDLGGGGKRRGACGSPGSPGPRVGG